MFSAGFSSFCLAFFFLASVCSSRARVVPSPAPTFPPAAGVSVGAGVAVGAGVVVAVGAGVATGPRSVIEATGAGRLGSATDCTEPPGGTSTVTSTV